MDVIYESALDYKVIEASVNNLLPCLQISIVRPLTARYRAFSDGTIQGAGLTVKCVKKAPENVTKILVWNAPTSYDDDSILPVSGISHYVIEYNGKSITISGDKTSYRINGLNPGTILFTMWTVDIDGIKSDPITTEG